MINLVCKLGTSTTKKLKVNKSDRLYTLLDKLDIHEKNARFIFDGKTYHIASDETFSDIGLIYDYARILVIDRPRPLSGVLYLECNHYKTNYYNIFSCCNNAYLCGACHDESESHRWDGAYKHKCIVCSSIFEGDFCNKCNSKKWAESKYFLY